MAERVHVYYQGDVDALLVHALTGVTGPFFFIRYWEGGPHVRIRVLAADLDQLVTRCADYLAAHPSVDRIDPGSFAAMTAALARREGVEATASREPNDSVRLMPYRFEHDRYGSGPAVRVAVERHFAESSQLALALLAAGIGADQRRAVALSAVLRTAEAGDWRWWAPPGVESAYRAVYQRQREALATFRQFDPRRPKVQAPRWLSLDADRPGLMWSASIGALRDAMPAAGRDRILDTCAHLFCNRLGLPPAQEGLVRYLAAMISSERADAR
jgi:thiopeptide-type bacteriocin biosynthesis protein